MDQLVGIYCLICIAQFKWPHLPRNQQNVFVLQTPVGAVGA